MNKIADVTMKQRKCAERERETEGGREEGKEGGKEGGRVAGVHSFAVSRWQTFLGASSHGTAATPHAMRWGHTHTVSAAQVPQNEPAAS